MEPSDFIALYALFVSIAVIIYNVKTFKEQSFETKFYNFLNHFLNRNEKIRIDFDICKEDSSGKLLIAHRTPNVNHQIIYNALKEYFINPGPNVLKILPKFLSYFKSIEFIISQINSSDKDLKKHYSKILLANLSDNEVHFICYYYYIFYDEINKGKKNIVKESKVFENIEVSSFYNHFDPRDGIFTDLAKVDFN
ncbi:MAG: hypothetical protein JXQ69_04560 [Paludibacteraceae bacterium]|nr:hypothetical protein [Paludibacteraceae bacterium]MBN2787580.1 hypothetical protein [Paludibacteraceae bacterium]